MNMKDSAQEYYYGIDPSDYEVKYGYLTYGGKLLIPSKSNPLGTSYTVRANEDPETIFKSLSGLREVCAIPVNLMASNTAEQILSELKEKAELMKKRS